MIPSGNISALTQNSFCRCLKHASPVADMQGNVAESYVYDPAGNILSKTVNGKTTTYTYDKANQLVSSTTEGKVIHYAYDAAGRLVKEGDKSYAYGWLDKVMSVSENGQKIASFNYHNDGQIAQAIRNGKSEDFLWDGLALIHRGETSFINEPYVTGGNPILSSKDGVMFNDMLGSTLNIGGKSVSMTAFGESADNDAMYTGKPYIGELGYAFLFRNYRADQGKWLTTDPLGYPDGWNNLAYCNNLVVFCIDLFGCDLYELLDKHAAGGNGHSLPIAVMLNPDGTWSATGYNYGAISFGTGTAKDIKTFTGTSVQDVLDRLIDYFDPNGNKYDEMFKWNVDNQRTKNAMDAMTAEVNLPYVGRTHNCLDITKSGLEAAGVYLDDPEWRPNQATEMRRNSKNVTNILKQLQE